MKSIKMPHKQTTKEEYYKRINHLREYINDHLDENFDLQQLAEFCGFSPWHFHRIVSAFLGESLGSYVIRMRIETAARLLRHSDLSVQEIAYRVGYEVPSSLSKQFRQFYGISPNDYRNLKNFTIMKAQDILPDLNVESKVIDIPEQPVVYIHLTGDYKTLDYGGTWMRLVQYLQQENLPMGDVCPLCIYHDDPKVTEASKLRTDICMSVSAGFEYPAKGEVGFKKIPAGRYAIFHYVGPYDQLGAVYDTIYAKKIPEMGLTFRDEPSYERYLNDPCTTDPKDLITEIYVAVE